MKKKNIKKLSLNKGSISQLDKINGGNPAPTMITLPACVSVNGTYCATKCKCATERILTCWIC
ncbi:hypothetical protein [Kordia sp.]|uniref:hypothetical protein n=1 Tax=Kordia sp. TaxID=1965332 RepID=UPI003B5C659F